MADPDSLTRNQAQRISETGDPKASTPLNLEPAPAIEDQHMRDIISRQLRTQYEGDSAVIKSKVSDSDKKKAFIFRENSSEDGTINYAELLESKKKGVFRQYTIEGDRINENEETPQKRLIDELMGRVPQISQQPMRTTRDEATPKLRENQDDLSNQIKQYGDLVHKTSSVGTMPLQKPF